MTTTDEGYALIDHTADVGVEVWARDFAGLLVHAGEALFSIITDLSSVRKAIRTDINLEPGEREEVMRSWLENLLSQFNRKEMLYSRFTAKELNERGIKARAWGEVFDVRRHPIHTEIKGITYHQFRVRRDLKAPEWTARIIFDV
ncbi:MAG: archease [Fidelibacterota bacterium]